MDIGIAAGKNGAVLAALLGRIYEAGGVTAQVYLLAGDRQNTHKAEDAQARAPFDILLIDTAACPLYAAGRTTMLSTDARHSSPALHTLPQGHRIVSYGFNGKSCITASSLRGEQLLVCLQRSFPCADGRMAEPMEFAVRRTTNGPDAQLLLTAIAAALCGGIHPDTISAFFEEA